MGENLVKKAEEFEAAENLSTKVLQLEKRFIEAELAVNQIKDLVKSLDVESLPELKKRIEDLEDLTMVENVGVTEIKKMLIALNEKMGRPHPEVFEKIEKLGKRVMDVERGLDAIQPPQEAKVPPEELDALVKDIQDIRAQFDVLKDKVESMKPSTSIGMLVKRVEDLREEMKPRVTAIERDLAVVKEKADTFAVPENVVNELTETKNSFFVNNANIESLENVVKDMTSDVGALKKDARSESRTEGLEKLVEQFGKELDEMRPSLKRLESFEKITNLKRDVEWKLEEFRVIEGEVKRLVDRTEAMHSNIDKKLDIIKVLETAMPEFRNSINELKKEIVENKIAIGSTVRREDIGDLIKRNVESFGKFGNRLDKLKKDVQEAASPVTVSNNKLERRVNMLEETQTKIMGTLDSKMKNVEEARISLESAEVDIKMIDELQRSLTEMNQRVNNLSTLVAGLSTKKTLDSIVPVIDKRLAELQEPAAALNMQVFDLIDRIVFLESRLGAIESEMQKRISAQPIILE